MTAPAALGAGMLALMLALAGCKARISPHVEEMPADGSSSWLPARMPDGTRVMDFWFQRGSQGYVQHVEVLCLEPGRPPALRLLRLRRGDKFRGFVTSKLHLALLSVPPGSPQPCILATEAVFLNSDGARVLVFRDIDGSKEVEFWPPDWDAESSPVD